MTHFPLAVDHFGVDLPCEVFFYDLPSLAQGQFIVADLLESFVIHRFDFSSLALLSGPGGLLKLGYQNNVDVFYRIISHIDCRGVVFCYLLLLLLLLGSLLYIIGRPLRGLVVNF